MNATPPNGLSPDDSQRLEDLLADRAVFGLDEAEQAELSLLLAATGRRSDNAYDLAAAAVASASVEPEPLPASIRARLFAAPQPQTRVSRPESAGAPSVERSGSRPIIALALAASLMAAFVATEANRTPSPDQARRQLLAQASDVVNLEWVANADPTVDGKPEDHAWGAVVWSDERQEGYLSFRGLAANDPSVEQYQLWVFDEARDDRFPVDGGVFDVPSATDPDEEFVVPINTKLPVSRATLFAITVEPPGGVVVSDRSRLPLLAQR